MNVDVLIEDDTARVQFVAPASTELMPSLAAAAAVAAAALLFRLVVIAAPFKLFIRAEALRRGVEMRFLGASVGASPEPTAPLETRAAVVLMLLAAKVDTPDAASVVMDVPCDCEPLLVAFAPGAGVVRGSPGGGLQPTEGEVTVLSGLPSLEFISWRMSGLLRRPCCCCSSVVEPTGAGSVFPK